MNNKIIKYLKCFISALLILSFVIPSFCAEGSAFITKEEVDKAFLDFNKRLVNFEAGINNKIDSQVSSYLDRNAIWSPLKQNKTNGYMLHNFYDTNQKTYIFTNGSNGFESESGTYKSTLDMIPKTPKAIYNQPGTLNERTYATEDIIAKVDKGGMLRLETTVYNVKQILGMGDCYDVRIYCNAYKDDSDKRSFVNYYWWGLRFYEETKEGEKIQRGQLQLFKQKPYPGDWKYLMFNQLLGRQQFYFFVNKDSRIYYEYIFEYICAGAYTGIPVEKNFEVPGGDGSGILVVFDTCEVY